MTILYTLKNKRIRLYSKRAILYVFTHVGRQRKFSTCAYFRVEVDCKANIHLFLGGTYC